MRRRFSASLISVLALGAAGAFSLPAQAGLLDFFQSPEPVPQRSIERAAPLDMPQFDPLPKLQIRKAPPRHVAVLPKKTLPDKVSVAALQVPAVSNDSTLREGDAIMTPHGIRVFASNQFVTLAETKGLSKEEHVALSEIDAHRSEEGSMTASDTTAEPPVMTGRSSASVHGWKWLRDPKGVLVRYVGP